MQYDDGERERPQGEEGACPTRSTPAGKNHCRAAPPDAVAFESARERGSAETGSRR